MSGIAPLFLRGDIEHALPMIEGYTISPTIAATSSCLLLSYVVLGLAPSIYVFATMTNLCYLGAGFLREAVSSTRRHSATSLVGQMAGGSLILVLLGASSFAFHRESQLWAPAHTLDILFGWLLVLHVLYVTLSVSFLAFVKYLFPEAWDRTGMWGVRMALSFGFLVAVTLLMTFYDSIYNHQTEFYFTVGPAAAVFGAAMRFILVRKNTRVQWHAVRIALVEMIVALTAILAAILAQGELLGRRLSRQTDPEAYDLFHGNWHFLLATVTSVLYSRAADAARIVQGSHVVCICELPHLDWFAEGLVFVYSVAVICLKEANVGTDVSTIVLGTLASGFLVHVVMIVTEWAARRYEDM